MGLKESMAADEATAAGGTAGGGSLIAACVEPRHFEAALANTFPSVSAKDRRAYAGLKKKLGRAHKRGVAAEAEAAAGDDDAIGGAGAREADKGKATE